MPRGQRKQLSQSTQSTEAQETQRTILKTANHLFMEHGYRSVSTRQIAELCGLTQPALYHYFADKQDLYVAVMCEELKELRTVLERIVHRNESVKERLKRIVRYLLSSSQTDLAMMFHDINTELSPQSQQLLTEEHHKAMIVPIATLFQEGIANGVLRDVHHGGVDALFATHLLLSMLSKLLMKPHNYDTDGTTKTYNAAESNYAEMIVNVLLHGLALPESQETERREMGKEMPSKGTVSVE